MKGLLLSAISIYLFGLTAIGQIPEGDFETWSSSGSCDEPAVWNTVNGTTAILGLCTAQQETVDPYSGSSALKLTSEFRLFAGQVIPGIVSNGTIDIQSQGVSGGVQFTERPTAFTGWYKAAPVNNDPYSMIAVLINENNGDTVGAAIFEGSTTVSSWTQFIVPVDYFTQDNPTLLQINLFSSDPLNPQDGSVVYFDELDYQSITVGVEEFDTESISVYPNPVKDELYFSIINQEDASVTLYNAVGAVVLDKKLTAAENHISMSEFVPGSYFWQLTSSNGNLLKTGKVVALP